jgi:hypothetical protein
MNSAYQQTSSSSNTMKNSNNISTSNLNKQVKNYLNIIEGSNLNNYQPELNKKNNFNTPIMPSNTRLLNRPLSQLSKQGPIK